MVITCTSKYNLLKYFDSHKMYEKYDNLKFHDVDYFIISILHSFFTLSHHFYITITQNAIFIFV